MKRTAVAPNPSSVPPSTSGFFIEELPFTRRWLRALDRVMREGGWWVLSGGAQQGKSTANRAFALRYPAIKREDGTVRVPVATTTACAGRMLLFKDLAESLGAKALIRSRADILEVLAAAIHRSGTRLIIVNNAHEMDWGQWVKLLALHEIYYRRWGIAPGIVFSAVGQDVAFGTLPSTDEALDQLRRRVFYEDIPGHTRAEVKIALQLFFQRRAPAVIERTDVLDHAGLAWELLTTEFFDPLRTKRVPAVDLDELAMRLEALYEAGERRGRTLIEDAVEDYRRCRSRSIQQTAA